MQGLGEDAFESLGAGESVELTFDVAELHDLSQGGAMDISAKGAIAYADEGSTEISGAHWFNSNTVSSDVDGAAAGLVRAAYHAKVKRQILQADCTSAKSTASKAAIANCASLATAAQQVAESGSAAKVEEYFKSSTAAVRTTVAGVFAKVATECGSPSAGVSKQYCSDVLRSCSSGVLAYTSPANSIMVNCNLYFSALPALTKQCHEQDQSTTTLHETTHLTQIKGTQDYGVYG